MKTNWTWWEKYLFVICIIAFFWSNVGCQSMGIIRCSPFPAECLVVYNMTYDELEVALDDSVFSTNLPEIEYLFDSTSVGFTTVIECEGNYPHYYMVFQTELGEDWESYNIIAHESLHLLQYIDSHYNIDFTKEVECNAYMFEYLTNQVYNIVKQ